MKIFVAGATGAVGRLLVPMLIKAGYEVVGTTRHAAKIPQITALGARALVADALDREAMFAALRAEHPDIVIHQLTDLLTRDFAANTRLRIEGSRNLVDAAKAVGVQRMIAQSIAWMSVAGDTPAREDEALDVEAEGSRRNGALAVQVLENAVAEMPIGIVLRYGLLYGPSTWYAHDGLTTEQVRAGEITANDGISSFVHVADAAQAAVFALDLPAGILNIVDDEPATGKEWLSHYASLVGAPPPPTASGKQGWERGASNAKAKEMGWRLLYPSWREGFKIALAAV